jgi:hypothetical protein
MSSLRVAKIFQAMPNQIKLLGGYSKDWQEAIVWQGRVDSTNTDGLAGKDACVIDFTSATWTSGTDNLRAVLVAIPAQDQIAGSVDASKTQSHAAGYFMDGGARFQVYFETAAAVTDAQSAFQRYVTHHLLGQNSAPVELFFCANNTEPTVEGVNGAGATASFTSAGVYLPYALGFAGGV